MSNEVEQLTGHAWVWRCLVLTWGRRLVIVALVVWGGYMLLWRDPSPQTCREELADGKPVQVCSDLSMADPVVLLLLLGLLLLLLPDAAEIEVPGVLRIKRQLETAQQEVDGLRQSVSTLQSQVASASARSSAVGVLVDQRQYQTGAAALGHPVDAAVADGAVDVVDQGTGAQLAFAAGFTGLPDLMPEGLTAAKLVGFTVDPETGELVLSHRHGELPDEVLGRANALALRSTHLMGLDIESDYGLLYAPAADDEKNVFGGLVVVVEREPSGERGATTTSALTNALGAVAAMGGAYARLLIDLLGETATLDVGKPRA